MIVVAIPVLALLLSVALSDRLNEQQRKAEAWVIHSYGVRTTIQSIFTSIAEASNGARGYLLSERETFLTPYEKALRELPEALTSLRTLVQDNAEQTARARGLESLVNAQLDYLNRLLNGAPAIPATVRNPLLVKSKVELDALRRLLAEMIREEDKLLEERARTEQFTQSRELAVLRLSGLVGLVGGFTAVMLFVNAVVRRIRLLEQNAALLSQDQPLQRLPKGNDEIGKLGRELQKSSDLLQRRAKALEGNRAEVEAQNRALAQQQARLAQLADFRQALVELFGASLREGSGSQFYQVVLERAVAVIPGAQAGSLLLCEDDAYGFVAAVGFDLAKLKGVRLRADELTLPQGDENPYVFQDFEVTRRLEARHRSVFDEVGRLDEIRATLTVPVIVGGERVAILSLDNFEDPESFGNEALEMAAAFAGQIGVFQGRFELEAELRRRNAELVRANELTKEFLANTSHELRTPLTAIIGFSELLVQEAFGPLNEIQTQYVNDIYESGEHLLALINDILDLSKIEAGKMELRLEPVDVTSLVEDVLTIVRERAHQAGLKLEVERPTEVLVLSADLRKLKQALYNLLSNAVKFTPAGGSVVLRFMAVPGEIRFEVVDTGVGIPLEAQNKLFKEFSQIDSSLAREHEGTGLGLALTKRLIELHGGRVWVESAPGVGSTFGIALPVEEEMPESPLEPAPEPTHEPAPPPEVPYILIVEDDDQAAALLATYLEDDGYCTARARDAREALALLRTRPPLALTLDLHMPNMGGQGFLEALTADPLLATPPVVIVSVDEPPHGVALGVAAVLAKPINRGALLQALREAVGSAADAETILIVDDDPLVLNLLDEQLKRLGHRVIAAQGGVAALECFRQERPDLVILDLLMPGTNGFEVIERLREAVPELPIMVLTSLDLSDEERQRLRGQVNAVTEKGKFDAAAFRRELERILPRPEVT